MNHLCPIAIIFPKNFSLKGYSIIVLFAIFSCLLSRQALPQAPNYSDVIESVSDCAVSLVAMSSTQQNQSSGANTASFSRGTAIVLSENGYLITNNHIVANADRYFVELGNGFVYEAALIGGDYATDIAVIKIDISSHPTCDFMTENDALEVGELVLGIGSPYSLPGSVSVGIISYIERPLAIWGEFTDYVLYIQTDLILNPGNSGGPLVNWEGKIIGMNSSTLLSETGSSGIAFAIPAHDLSRVSRQLIRNGLSEKGHIGIEVAPLPQTAAQIQGLGLAERRGAIVSNVEMNSPAYHAGVRTGDIVVTVNRKVVEDEHKFRYLIGSQEAGSRVRLSIIREGNFFSTEVTAEGKVIGNPDEQ